VDAVNTAVPLDPAAIARACERYGVVRLRVFGSVLTDRFDPISSDVDFLVDFAPGRGSLLHDQYGLKTELERVVGRPVDLIEASAVSNPYFAKTVFATAQDVYAA